MIARDGSRARLTGPLTMSNAAKVSAAARAALADGATVFDFGGLTEVDSSALSVMLELIRAGRAAGRVPGFDNLPENLQSFAALYGVADLVGSVPRP